MLRVIPYPPPPRQMVQGDRMQGHHTHQPPNSHLSAVAALPKPQPITATPATVARVYKTCTNLFLTRRLPDALAALQPIIADAVSPRVKCSRALRTKVWSLYFAILDAAAKMGAEEGKNVWGVAEWRKIVAKVRTGAVWDEVNTAYGGEGRVDGDVVNALITLLLAHSPDQTVTQKKIEAYLSAAPNLMAQDDDPKGVSQRVKLVELYILHVLPRVGDWEYARDFAHMSCDLDDEQKEIFQATLDQLQKDFEDAQIYADELQRVREEELARERKRAEDERTRIPTSSPPSVSGNGATTSGGGGGGGMRTAPKKPITKKPKSGSVRGSSETGAHRQLERTTNGNGVREGVAKTKADSTSLFTATTALLNRLQAQMGTSQGRFAMLRTVIMVAVVVWMTSKRRVRERIRRLLMLAWIKTTRTVGMGMKVTYI